MEWWFFALGLVVSPLLGLLAKAINQWVIEYRRKRFLKLVKIDFPDNSKITLISVDTTDKRAMAKLERQLRDEYDLIALPEDEERGGDRDGLGEAGLSLSLPRRTAARSDRV